VRGKRAIDPDGVPDIADDVPLPKESNAAEQSGKQQIVILTFGKFMTCSADGCW
jgi:hypothetical protein